MRQVNVVTGEHRDEVLQIDDAIAKLKSAAK
jgi:hypothetical protein